MRVLILIAMLMVGCGVHEELTGSNESSDGVDNLEVSEIIGEWHEYLGCPFNNAAPNGVTYLFEENKLVVTNFTYGSDADCENPTSTTVVEYDLEYLEQASGLDQTRIIKVTRDGEVNYGYVSAKKLKPEGFAENDSVQRYFGITKEFVSDKSSLRGDGLGIYAR